MCLAHTTTHKTQLKSFMAIKPEKIKVIGVIRAIIRFVYAVSLQVFIFW